MTDRKIKCELCDCEAEMPDTHVLPDGWEQYGMGEDICPECDANILTALKRIRRVKQ